MTGIRIFLGLFAYIAISVAADWLLASLGNSIHPTVRVVFVSFVGACVGGFIARRRFFVPALLVWASACSFVVYALYRFAGPFGQGSVTIYATLLMLSALGLVAGVAAGQMLARSRVSARGQANP